MIPTNDLLAGYLQHRTEIDEAVRRVLESGWYILGKEVEAFEREFADWLGVRTAVGVANGTDALMLALRAAGVQPGDGVLTVSHTAVATVAAIEMAQALPLLVDVDEHSYIMDPNKLAAAIRTAQKLGIRCRAIVPVHLYGNACEMESLASIAAENELVIVEDCSQSHGARYKGQMTGTFGTVSAYSLYPTKNLGALGDAGVIVTSSSEIENLLRKLRQYGWQERNNSLVPGVNSRLDELQAAILRVRLKHLDANNLQRQRIAGLYDEGLRELPVILPERRSDCEHVFHQYVIRGDRRDDLQTFCRRHGVSTMIHYPLPVHQQSAYAGRLPVVCPLDVTERLVRGILSLPISPSQSPEVTRQVIAVIRKFFEQG